MFDDIDKSMAVDACNRALEGGSEAKLLFRYARALLADNPTPAETQKALVAARASFDSGYELAGIALGYMFNQNLPGLPRDPAESLRYQLAAAKAGSMSGKYSAGVLLLEKLNDPSAMSDGLRLLEEAAVKYPEALVVIGDFFFQQRAIANFSEKAIDAYKRADAAGLSKGAFRLGTAYQTNGTNFYAPAQGLEYLLRAANANYQVAIPEVAKAYYFANGTTQNYSKALEWANKGAQVGEVYSQYMAGHMYFKAQGTAKDTLRAEALLKQAVEQGSESAKKLLDDEVTAYANALRAMPKTEAMSCVEKRPSSFDANVTSYYNTCDLTLTAIVCKRIVATEFISIFDGKDREQCTVRNVGPRSYIDLLYGAADDSALLRKIVANTSIRIGACHPPLMPRLAGGSVFCEQT